MRGRTRRRTVRQEAYAARLLTASVFLWIAAVQDYKTQRISVWIPGAFFAAAVAANLSGLFGTSAERIWAGAVPGAVFLLLSAALGDKIGEGDGICLIVSGLFTGFVPAVLLSEIALAAAALHGGIAILAGKKKAGDRIAFVPYLAAAESLLLVIAVAEL